MKQTENRNWPRWCWHRQQHWHDTMLVLLASSRPTCFGSTYNKRVSVEREPCRATRVRTRTRSATRVRRAYRTPPTPPRCPELPPTRTSSHHLRICTAFHFFLKSGLNRSVTTASLLWWPAWWASALLVSWLCKIHYVVIACCLLAEINILLCMLTVCMKLRIIHINCNELMSVIWFVVVVVARCDA